MGDYFMKYDINFKLIVIGNYQQIHSSKSIANSFMADNKYVVILSNKCRY